MPVLSSLFFQLCLLCWWFPVFIPVLVIILILVISAHLPFTDFLILIPGTLLFPLLFVSTNCCVDITLSRQGRIFPLYISFLFLTTLLS